MHYICKEIKEVRDVIWPTEVQFAGHMRREDLPMEIVSKNQHVLLKSIGNFIKKYKSCQA